MANNISAATAACGQPTLRHDRAEVAKCGKRIFHHSSHLAVSLQVVFVEVAEHADALERGLIDLVGYALDGIYVALNTGRGFARDEKWLSDQVANKRWDKQTHTGRKYRHFQC